MMSFNHFIQKYKTKKVTSNTKIYEVPSSNGLGKLDIYPKNGPFSGEVGFFKLQPKKKNTRGCIQK